MTLDHLQLWNDPDSRPGPENMAVDEWLLETASEPVLRVYGWERDWVSVGYFGSMQDAGGMMQDIAKFAIDLQGLGGAIVDPEIAAASARLQAMLMRSPAVRIEGGTDQILRNIISERVLGLPREPR